MNSLIPQAIAHFQGGNLPACEALLKKALQLNPDYFDAHHILGVVYVHQSKRPLAVESFRKAVDISPDNSFARFNLATVLAESGNDFDALPHFSQAVKLAPSDQDTWVNYGRSLANLGRWSEALDCYGNALKINPNHAEALSNQGIMLSELGRNEEALSCFQKALAVNPSLPSAWSNKGNALKNLKRYEEALADYDRAIHLSPAYADTWSNKGNALGNLRRYDEALAHYDRAIHLEPDNADAWFNKAYTLGSMKRYDHAMAHYDRAIQLDPDNASAWYNKGNLLGNLNRYDEALVYYNQAFQLNPDHDFLYGDRLSAKRSICDWSDAESEFAEFANKLKTDKNVSTPFTVLSICDDPWLQRKAAESYAKNFPANPALGAIAKRPLREKIRVGYFSKDFNNHATAFLTAELFEIHDRSKFEVIALSFGPDASDNMRSRLSLAFDRFIDVRDKSDMEIAQLSRELEIDIAVDLQGYQTEHRTGIFAHRAAPVQVNYLAYPGTMGVDFMDYLIADGILIPPESLLHYSEKIAYLPNSYQANDRQRTISERSFSRVEFGLPEDAFVFCCFNSLYKITPATFDSWMKILGEVKGSVLWLFEGNSIAVNNLKKQAERSGISAERLIFAKFMDLPDHLARHRLADLFLDTHPYNAHTTASDALWAGLPVLSCLGKSFASRVAASLLNAVHLPELITHTQEDYEQLAIQLAKQPTKLAELKRKLANNRLTTPLFDTPLYCKHLEAAYTAMIDRSQADLPPDHILCS